jgi:serine/threonine protein kinase
MRHHQAMEAIKSLVTESVHHELNPEDTVVNTVQATGINRANLSNVPFEELKRCCNNFNPDTQIGRGGFGEVYKGQRNCNDIAVKRIRGDKRMNKESYRGIINQFISELKNMHSFPAENILLLLCYSFTKDLSTEPCLVYQVSFI